MGGFEDLFGALSVEQVETFRETVTADVMHQLGAPRSAVKRLRASLAEAFGTEWFNNQGYIPVYLAATRCDKFNVLDLLSGKRGAHLHPLSQAWMTADHEAEGQDACCVVKCATVGTLVLTALEIAATHIHVNMGGHGSYRIYRGTGFFTQAFGDVCADIFFEGEHA
jgi:hypothetical protein